MANENVKELLIKATVKLLNESENPGRVTARQIVSEAGVNLAMINYYFNSKNELMKISVGRIIEERANSLKEIYSKAIPPKEKLIEFLTGMTEITLEYAEITKSVMSYSLLEGDMEPIYYILPIVRECYGDDKTETECRLIAMQLISAFQLIFYRSDQFEKYTGIDIMLKEQRDKLISTIIGLYI